MTGGRPHEGQQDPVVVPVAGEIDIANSAQLEARLLAAGAGGRRVVVDLGAVTFLDATGLTALLCGRRAAVEHGGSLVLADVPPSVSRILRITALDAVLPVAP